MFRHIFMFISWTVWLIKTYTLKKKKRKHNEGELPQSGKGKIDMQVQVAQGVPKKLDPRRNTPRHIIITVPKIKEETILKAAREKETVTYKGIPIRLSADFSKETLPARRGGQEVFEVLKGKNLHPNYSIQQSSHLEWEGRYNASQIRSS